MISHTPGFLPSFQFEHWWHGIFPAQAKPVKSEHQDNDGTSRMKHQERTLLFPLSSFNKITTYEQPE
jgi:hypothetical protein